MQEAIDVACLCAAWCHICTDYAPLFDRVTAEFAGGVPALRRHWIDIEDEADLVGDFDVETFPTVAVIGPEGVRFAGPLEPREETLRRLLRAVLAPAAQQPPAAAAPAVVEFAARLRAAASTATERPRGLRS